MTEAPGPGSRRLGMNAERNYDVMHEDGQFPVKSWTQGVEFDNTARAQLNHLAKLPFIHKWIAVMPDVHTGIGATIGSVIPTHRAIIPAAVGVDIGCGMMAVQTSLKASDLPDDLKTIRASIEKAVPHGFAMKGRDRGGWGCPTDRIVEAWKQLEPGFRAITEKHPVIKNTNNVVHLGTLGTGNHFIEICLDESDQVWFMLHSGSRGVGNRIGRHFIEMARKDMERWFINLPNADLAYFPEGTDHFDDYVQAVDWAQRFAALNREVMMEAVIRAVSSNEKIPPFKANVAVVNCHHNYVARESHFGQNVFVTRKGAVRAREGDLGIIPGSMGTRSYIVRGKGNNESFHSCSHGAGRAMSRTEAKRRFTLEDHARATEGVECRKDVSVIDETPAAYKSIDAVMEAQKDLVDIVHTLKQVVCVKG